MSSDDVDGTDLTLLLNKFRPGNRSAKAPNGAPVSSRAKRQAAEKRAMLSPTDGRRRRGGVVRDAQLNFKVPSDVKRRVTELAAAMNIAMVDVLEMGLALLEAEHEEKSKGGN